MQKFFNKTNNGNEFLVLPLPFLNDAGLLLVCTTKTCLSLDLLIMKEEVPKKLLYLQ